MLQIIIQSSSVVDISKLRPLKQKLCSNLGGLRRSSRDLRPVNYDYDASGDVELQRSKRHVDVTVSLYSFETRN